MLSFYSVRSRSYVRLCTRAHSPKNDVSAKFSTAINMQLLLSSAWFDLLTFWSFFVYILPFFLHAFKAQWMCSPEMLLIHVC